MFSWPWLAELSLAVINVEPTVGNVATPPEVMLTTLLLFELQVTPVAGDPLSDAVKVCAADPTLKLPLELRPQGVMLRPAGGTGVAVA